ncbi:MULTISPECIES: ATP/GTP-binding protein [unclassified Polaribacter]|jgi:AAA15 family ATPase/GTPase|uniref:AAA family ATPase n=1 Tax=unclassified Polaribacter TaxID=196858 RepID=UPI001C4E31C4|nr:MULTISPECIES: ATP-binding protein [unclassified Polaribacter]QXP63274.1 ATP-binding protein [Polaribacter sp. HaHaR_3_91]QXP65725.1 ATP-binding protein [Polaribacter sp. AHE13PA]
MLIEFKCRNFLSFKDEICLNLSTVDTYTEHKDTHILKTNKLNLLKSIALYGSNGGGKSNLSRAITLMDNLIHYSFRDSLNKDEERGDWTGDFKLCNDTIGKPSMFEVSFFVGEDIYRYGFEMYNWEVISEWLYKTEKRETLLFSRKGNDFKINETRFEEGKRYKEVNQNVLFISFLAQYNSGESGKVFNFFKKLNIVNALSDDHISHVTRKLLKDDEKFKKWLSIALQFLEISSVHVSPDEKELLSKHPVYDENNLLTGFTDFSVERNESDGTKKLIYLLGAIYHTLKHGSVFVIDEFNSKLHPNLSLKIIELFHKYNNNGAQFIITVHDPTLLDKDVYRRDQFWFVDRNQFGSSELYPMSNFKATDGLRSMSDFRKKYLNSDFGAAESIELTQEFINISKEI